MTTRRSLTDAAQHGELGEGAGLLVEHHQQREVRGGRQLARESELRGHGSHDERHDLEELARRFACLITGHRSGFSPGPVAVTVRGWLRADASCAVLIS